MKNSHLIQKILPFILLLTFCLSAQEKPTSQDQPNLFNQYEETFIANGEFLYWTIHEGSLDYAIRMKHPTWSPHSSYAQGNVEKASFSWDPGFRLAFGYYRASNFWEILGQWTKLYVDGKDRTKRPSEANRYLNGTFPHIFTEPVTSTTSHIFLRHDLVDLIVHRVFHPFNNPHLRLRLLGGIPAVWIKQQWKIRYFNAENNRTTTTNRWRYWGIGLRTGIGADWFVGWDIYLTGKFTTALLIGRYHNKAKQKTTAAPQPADNPALAVGDLCYKDYRFAFTNQFLLGPSYQKNISKRRLEIFAGYELTFWANLQEIYRSNNGEPQRAKETFLNTGMIAMHGLTTRITLNF